MSGLRTVVAAAMEQAAAIAQDAWGKTLEYRSDSSSPAEAFPGRISGEGLNSELEPGGLGLEFDAEARWRKRGEDGLLPVPEVGGLLKAQDTGRIYFVRKIYQGEDAEWKVGLESAGS